MFRCLHKQHSPICIQHQQNLAKPRSRTSGCRVRQSCRLRPWHVPSPQHWNSISLPLYPTTTRFALNDEPFTLGPRSYGLSLCFAVAAGCESKRLPGPSCCSASSCRGQPSLIDRLPPAAGFAKKWRPTNLTVAFTGFE